VDRSTQHDLRHTPTLAETGWTDARQEMFRDICGRHMTAFGYPM
jgi:hypothetical protein